METEKIINKAYYKMIRLLVVASITSDIIMKVYEVLKLINLEFLWVITPTVLFLLAVFFQYVYDKYIFTKFELTIVALTSMVISLIIMKFSLVEKFFVTNETHIITTQFIFMFLLLAVETYGLNESKEDQTKSNTELFNLFYINTSKVHEIAMLIDNRIMKTVESQKGTQKIRKHGLSMKLFKNSTRDANGDFSYENINQSNVYENFDVKMTKSIMLRTIYSSINKEKVSSSLGNILLFKNIELEQINTDDTVMVLNVLKDSNMKQLSNDENFELNISKMMEEMLVDFTIDYVFIEEEKKYLIRIPYNSKDCFENSYAHSDLQLGKLSVVGIYRGEINFDDITSISTKFLEFFSSSYTGELERSKRKKNTGLLPSSSRTQNNDLEFEIKPTKLSGNYHLIDLLAIIQEINLKEELKNE